MKGAVPFQSRRTHLRDRVNVKPPTERVLVYLPTKPTVPTRGTRPGLQWLDRLGGLLVRHLPPGEASISW